MNNNTKSQEMQTPIQSSIKDFEIVSVIGKGAFSKVFKAKRLIDNQYYALKQVSLINLSEKERDNSFNEVRLLASINNINVISYKDSFIDKNNHLLYLIMEYADNGDLEQKIQSQIEKKELLYENLILSYFEQIAKGLKALHDKNILHRDLKAANIFMFNNDIVKIGDMNVSKVMRKGLKNTQTGTPFYASPEIWENKPYDFKSDIWSLGCLLYEMTTLKAPFRGTTMKDVCLRVTKGVFDPIPKQYSNHIIELIRMCLNIKHEERPSCSQLLIYIKKIRATQEGLSTISYNKKETTQVIRKDVIKKIKLNLDLKDININLPKSRYATILKKRNPSAVNFGLKKYYKNYSQINQTEEQDTTINDNNITQENQNINTSFKKKLNRRFNYSSNNIRTEENNDNQLNLQNISYSNNNKTLKKQSHNQIVNEIVARQKAQIEKELGFKKISQMKKRLLTKEIQLNKTNIEEEVKSNNKMVLISPKPLKLKRSKSNPKQLIKKKGIEPLTPSILNKPIAIKPLNNPEDTNQNKEADNNEKREIVQYDKNQSKQLAEEYLEKQRALSANVRIKNRSNRSDHIKSIFSINQLLLTEQSTNKSKHINLPQVFNGKAPVYLHTKTNNSVQMFNIFHNIIPNQHGQKIKKINLNHFNKKSNKRNKSPMIKQSSTKNGL